LVLVGTTLFGTSFLGSFIPKGTPLALTPILAPIEIVSYSARAFSLGIRLFSNILAGHTLLAILSGFILAGIESGLGVIILSCIASVVFSLLVVLEIAVSGIQSYVFGVLVGSYIEGTV
jgi:F-type H+-transporting ATPase subunit a